MGETADDGPQVNGDEEEEEEEQEEEEENELLKARRNQTKPKESGILWRMDTDWRTNCVDLSSGDQAQQRHPKKREGN